MTPKGSSVFNSRSYTKFSLSLSKDGNTLAVGQTSVDSVNVFRYNEDTSEWNELGQVLEANEPQTGLGFTVSLSDDGSILAVGAELHRLSYVGSAQVFRLIEGKWTQVGDTIFGNDSFDYFSRVSLSGDGQFLAVGAPKYGINPEVFAKVFRLEEGQ